MMDLERLVAALGAVEVVGRAPVEVHDLAYDARHVVPGSLFFCVPGARFDGHDFAAQALEAGAAALVVERPLDVSVPQFVVGDSRAAMAPVADEFFGRPTEELQVVGVTGTNGKTTTAFLLYAILAAASRRPGLTARSRRVSAASDAASSTRRRRRSTCSGCFARCSTRATARSRWKPRRTRPHCTVSIACALPHSCSRT